MNFTWCGQSCGSTSRAFIHEAIYDAVLARVKAKIKYYKPGIPTDPATTMGAIVSKAQFDRVMSFIDSAKSEGAQLITGGGPPADPALSSGFYIEPTVFAVVDRTCGSRARRFSGRCSASSNGATRARCSRRECGRVRPHRSIWTNDLSTAHRTALAVEAGYRLDQRGQQALPRRTVRRLQAIGPRARGMLRGDARLHAGKEHPREAESTKGLGRRIEAGVGPGGAVRRVAHKFDKRRGGVGRRARHGDGSAIDGRELDRGR